MKRMNLCAITTALIAFGGAGAASAQTPGPVGISIRAGLFFPTSSSTSDAGSTWFAFGAQYKLLNLGPQEELHPHLALSIDYFARNSVDEIPILLNYVIRKDSVFGSVGAGVNVDHTPGNSSTHFGYQLGVGYDLPVTGVPIFVEAKFWGNDNSNYNGFGVYAGIRF